MQSDKVKMIHGFGYRLTPQRAMILKIIQDKKGHVGVSEIIQKVKSVAPEINVSTIYRTLDFFIKFGFITHMHTKDGDEYEYGEAGHHQHLICKSCGSSKEIRSDLFVNLAKEIKEKYGFLIEMKHVPVFGVCDECFKQVLN
jgi:Fur family transcriptional regulator, ferric uptake regulator